MPAYSDTLGERQKCHCKRGVTVTTYAEMALSHVEVKFLPKNTTSIMQPMDQERVQPCRLQICESVP